MRKQVLMMLLTLSSVAFTQDNQGRKKAPKMIDIDILLSRFYEIGISGKHFSQNNNLSVFNARGALLYETDYDQIELDYNQYGRDLGVLYVPIDFSIAHDGRSLITVGAISFKDLNSADKYDFAGGKIIDNVEFFKYEYDKSMTVSEIESSKIKFISYDLNVGIFKDKNNFIAVSQGSAIGSQSTKLGGQQINETIGLSNSLLKLNDYSINYGLFAHFENKKWTSNANIQLQHRWSHGEELNTNEAKSRYEFYVKPSLSVSRVFNEEVVIEGQNHTNENYYLKGPGKQKNSKYGPLEVGLNLYYNLIVKDKLTGQTITQDLSGLDRDTFGVKMSLRF